MTVEYDLEKRENGLYYRFGNRMESFMDAKKKAVVLLSGGLDSVTCYEKHAAPGETVISCEDPEVGFSLYWNDSELLIAGANLSETGKRAKCTIRLPGTPEFPCEMSLEPLSVSTQKIKKAELQNEE